MSDYLGPPDFEQLAKVLEDYAPRTGLKWAKDSCNFFADLAGGVRVIVYVDDLGSLGYRYSVTLIRKDTDRRQDDSPFVSSQKKRFRRFIKEALR